MSDLIREFWELIRDPFTKDFSEERLWLDKERQSSSKLLEQTVRHRQHALVVGESGVGKTCILRGLRESLSQTQFRVLYIAHVTLGKRDFFRQLCFAMGLEPKATPAAMFEAIQRDCTTRNFEHTVHSVAVLDEMHLMPDTTLSQLHLLANFNWDKEPLLSMVFVGLPEFHDRLKLGIHRPLLTRIQTKIEISTTNPQSTSEYVRKRLADAGASSEIFTADGLATLHEFTAGIIRSIDVLATAALRIAALRDTKLVDRDMVRRALETTPLS